MTLLLVAHGTREAAGAVEVTAIADAVRDRLGGEPVAVAYVDVLRPGIADVLAMLPVGPSPVVLVPAFLAAGYHVRVDVPREVAASGRSDVLVTSPLGPHPALVAAAYDRLRAAGWRRGDAVLLAAAGSSDPRARQEVRAAAALLERWVGHPVSVGFAASSQPLVADAVAAMRADGQRRIAAASWLLAPGLFHQAFAAAGADVVADPLGAHPKVVDLVARRYLTARCYRGAA
jgi:sirohydrochlorin ferrochelatase